MYKNIDHDNLFELVTNVIKEINYEKKMIKDLNEKLNVVALQLIRELDDNLNDDSYYETYDLITDSTLNEFELLGTEIDEIIKVCIINTY